MAQPLRARAVAGVALGQVTAEPAPEGGAGYRPSDRKSVCQFLLGRAELRRSVWVVGHNLKIGDRGFSERLRRYAASADAG